MTLLDLDTFRKLARETYSFLLSRGNLKRTNLTKASSGTTGVFPYTVMAMFGLPPYVFRMVWYIAGLHEHSLLVNLQFFLGVFEGYFQH